LGLFKPVQALLHNWSVTMVVVRHWLSRTRWLPDEESTGVIESSITASHLRASSCRRWGFFVDAVYALTTLPDKWELCLGNAPYLFWGIAYVTPIML